MTGGDLSILVPVLGRPHRVEPVLRSALAATPDALVVFVAEPADDPTLAALDAVGADFFTHDGNYAEKINEGIRATDRLLMFSGADDVAFHEGWFEAALGCIAAGAHVVGTNDLCNPRVMAGEHSTHFLFTRAYVDEWGTIDELGKLLHEGYLHEYVDNEVIETAQARGMYAHADDAHVEHLHPLCGKAPNDALYEGMPVRMVQGKRLFNKRRHLWSR